MDYARYKKTVSSALFIHFTLLACYVPFGYGFEIAGKTSPRAFLQATEVFAILLVFFNSSIKQGSEKKKAIINTVKDLLFRETV